MNLVVVESPTKARTIGRFLGKDYEIQASMGHVMDLPKSKLGVDVEHDFNPQYEIMADKKKTIAQLKSTAKSAENIILATDPDREGEAIAAHVAELLGGSKKGGFKRIVFHEITKEAIEEALSHPGVVNENLVNAQTARRVLDRLVGYKLSPLLWQKVRRGLSAGRVQSVALRLIVEREKEIEKFKKEPYFTVSAFLKKGSGSDVEFELIETDGKKIEEQKKLNLYDGEYSFTKTTLETQESADETLADLKTKAFVVSDVLQKEMRRSPQPPYTTSTLQQDASRRLGLPGKRTMSLAQKLYEEGYITYHRTDAVTIAASAQKAMTEYVKKEFGDKYVPTKPRFFSNKQKLAQEAHEAIRPTKIGVLGAAVTQDLGAAYGKLYDLIWRRALASQMSDAVTESTAVMVDAKSSSGPSYRFKANGSVLVFDGFLRVNPFGLSDKKLPQYAVSDKLTPSHINAVPHETQAPPRYNDASLIKTLEEKGIGRPSTYAAIISTIELRKYIERQEGKFVPTSIGTAVTEFLVENFSEIDDIPFTAEMEDLLDDIASGKKEWKPEMKKFYEPFEKQVETVGKKAVRVKIEVETLDEKCPTCGNPLVVRMGRFGKFISCSTFPECKFTKPFVEETGFTCPRCLPAGRQGGRVIVKKTRKGRTFYGCSNYPACDFAAWNLNDIKQASKPTVAASEKQN